MTVGMMGAAALMLAVATPQSMGAMPAAGATPAAVPVCPATPAPLPALLAGWSAMTPLAAGTAADIAPVLPIGSGARVTLADAAGVRFAATPGHAPGAGSRAGLLVLTIASAGRYRVALGAGAWIDLVAGTATLTSAAHDHGPACSPVRKLVDFELKPGRYLLQLSGTTAPAIGVMVVRLP